MEKTVSKCLAAVLLSSAGLLGTSPGRLSPHVHHHVQMPGLTGLAELCRPLGKYLGRKFKVLLAALGVAVST